MNEGHPDFAPLDPTGDPDQLAAIVAAIHGRAESELARRQGATIAGELVTWRRPTLTVAAALAVLCVIAGVLAGRGTSIAGQDPTQVTDDLDIPAYLVRWASEGRAPSAGELVFGMESR